MFIVDKNELLENIIKMQRTKCSYDMFGFFRDDTPPPDVCDCKYGASGQGEQTGCPELRCVTALLNLMTEKEYLNIMHRGNIVLI